MNFLQFLLEVQARLQRYYIQRDEKNGSRAICYAAQDVAEDRLGNSQHYHRITCHVSKALEAVRPEKEYSYASGAAYYVMDAPALTDDAGLYIAGPLAGAIRLFWVDQMIHATERALPLPPFPTKEQLAPLFEPYLVKEAA